MYLKVPRSTSKYSEVPQIGPRTFWGPGKLGPLAANWAPGRLGPRKFLVANWAPANWAPVDICTYSRNCIFPNPDTLQMANIPQLLAEYIQYIWNTGFQFSRGPICRSNIFQGPICQGPICRGPICRNNWSGPNLPRRHEMTKKNCEIWENVIQYWELTTWIYDNICLTGI